VRHGIVATIDALQCLVDIRGDFELPLLTSPFNRALCAKPRFGQNRHIPHNMQDQAGIYDNICKSGMRRDAVGSGPIIQPSPRNIFWHQEFCRISKSGYAGVTPYVQGPQDDVGGDGKKGGATVGLASLGEFLRS